MPKESSAIFNRNSEQSEAMFVVRMPSTLKPFTHVGSGGHMEMQCCAFPTLICLLLLYYEKFAKGFCLCRSFPSHFPVTGSKIRKVSNLASLWEANLKHQNKNHTSSTRASPGRKFPRGWRLFKKYKPRLLPEPPPFFMHSRKNGSGAQGQPSHDVFSMSSLSLLASCVV